MNCPDCHVRLNPTTQTYTLPTPNSIETKTGAVLKCPRCYNIYFDGGRANLSNIRRQIGRTH